MKKLKDLSKFTPAMLEAVEEYRKVWKGDDGMLEYAINKLSGAVILDSGAILVFEKPRIETEFCYGYGDYGVSNQEEEDFANMRAENALRKEAFIRNNLKEVEWYDFLKEEREGYYIPSYNGTTRLVHIYPRRYYGHRICFDTQPFNPETGRYVPRKGDGVLTDADCDRILAEVERQKGLFLKRLEAYWKRYGNSKIRTWTYLRD